MHSTYGLAPPSAHPTPTCRRGQMSEWRQKGFVQDSDEDDQDSPLESQASRRNAHADGRVERVEIHAKVAEESPGAGFNAIRTTEAGFDKIDRNLAASCTSKKFEPSTPTRKRLSPKRPTASPLTPVARYHSTREPTESPDPLQYSPSSKLHRHQRPSQPHSSGPPRFDTTSPPPGAQRPHVTLFPPTEPSDSVSKTDDSIPKNVGTNVSPNVLSEFGIQPLSDASDDEPLSDPPSDLESPEGPFLTYQPHRKTAVQVVIPASTVLQRHLYEAEAARREFRQRKPIQLHPYALEGELYRREVQSRGLKPVPRPRSPGRRIAAQGTETQERDFDPNETPDSSPPEVEIPISTPIPRRPRADKPQGVSSKARIAEPRLPATQLNLPRSAKRRKLNVSSTQAAAVPTSIFDDVSANRAIWSIPLNSPPRSSSPRLIGPRSTRKLGGVMETPAPTLPTPSTSSVFQDDLPQMLDSDPDQGSRTSSRPNSDLRRPARVVLSDLSSSSSESSQSETEQSSHELRRVGKKIKGVLPASWLRFDQRAQERRQTQVKARERERTDHVSTLSPDPEPQRGVAQRVPKRVRAARLPVSIPPTEPVVVISDGSDDEQDNRIYHPVQDVQDSVENAAALAASFDRRYADDDSDNMEIDRLHLFHMGGPGSKRKKQTKLTDAFGQAKRRNVSEDAGRQSRLSQLGKRQHQRKSRAIRRSPPPALSVVDADFSLSNQNSETPQFLRLARRQALRRPDLARQSPRTKQIRLHNFRDTEEANATLNQWRNGALKPKKNVSPRREVSMREPLADRINNQQSTQGQTYIGESRRVESGARSKLSTAAPKKGRHPAKPPALEMFQRNNAHAPRSGRAAKPAMLLNKVLQRSIRSNPSPWRAGQLESDETALRHGRHNGSLEETLRHADRLFVAQIQDSHTYLNPQLARYLADDDAVLPPLPSAIEIGEELAEHEATQYPPPRRRLIRKSMRVQRIDVDAREFRQPNEQAVQEILGCKLDNQVIDCLSPKDGIAILNGLGPHGTCYSTTYDVTPLQPDTYFHSSTLIGSEDLRRALSVDQVDSRRLDEAAGYCTISYSDLSARCGPWSDETSSALSEIVKSITAPLETEATCPENGIGSAKEVLQSLARFVRSLINYVSTHLSFSDPVDRQTFVVKMQQLSFSLFDQVSVIHDTKAGHSSLRVMVFLLVLSVQTSLVARSAVADQHVLAETRRLVQDIAKAIVTHIIRTGASELGAFLEQNKRYAVRQNGIQEDDATVEGVVVCIHALDKVRLPQTGFWDTVSKELTSSVTSATHITVFETAWATLFSMVPFVEVDIYGIPARIQRDSFSSDDWGCISAILRRLLELYQSTFRKHGSSLNDYVRANLSRCHRLIKFWHWQRPEQMLNAVFDFFGRNGLKSLRQETASGSVAFLDHATDEKSLSLVGNESSFHIALKCLALGLRGMSKCYTEKKIRSFVFRTIPNHGRSYPKDQPLDEESLTALRNHHDLLCTLYWASPPSCRPKLELLRGLISHETSHREACRVNVRAWANLTAFQLSSQGQYATAKPFALWHKDIMHQTLKQYRLAKSEADDYLKSGILDVTADVSVAMVRQTMERNQEQVIATLRDCIQGMRRAIQTAADQGALNTFLIDSDIVHLLELPHLEDRRLIKVIGDVLLLLQEYVTLEKPTSNRKESQTASEDSQDYGDFPDMDDLDDLEPGRTERAAHHQGLDFVQSPLWQLLSNAFGAEIAPDDKLLMDCVDTWILVAKAQVSSGYRAWSHFLDSFSQKSWHQLRQTEQTRKFAPYFFARLADHDRTAYEDHRTDYNTALLLSLVDRDSMLRFQDRLLHTIMRVDESNPLTQNLPFFRDETSGEWDINSETLRSRRHALISSILSNMRGDLLATTTRNPTLLPEVRRTYATMLHEVMNRMKGNYQQLQQGTTITGSYVDFVQKIVQFLKQYTGDICPVISFFTDSVAFPLPSTDPTYVVGRLCGYAPKANESGTFKQLSVFIQTVAQQAAADNQQIYLVGQLTTALCSNETPAADRRTLRDVLLQGIFPIYLEKAFSSSVSFLIAGPILKCLPSILETLMFDLRITQPDSVSSIMASILAVGHAFIRGTARLIDTAALLQQPHILCASTHMLKAMASILPVLEYVYHRTTNEMHSLVAYMSDFSVYIAEQLQNMESSTIPDYEGDAHSAAAPGELSSALLAFCRRGLEDSLKANWSEAADGTIRFGQGHARKDVVFDIGTVEEEKECLMSAVDAFQRVLRNVYGGQQDDCHDARETMVYDIVV
ncbi:hypothetical protein ACEQ8H_003126 [Pleosporales sp. CAS-2024a]